MMLSDLEPDQRALAEFMSDLSERAWCAGWQTGLEHALWRAVVSGPTRYGRLDITHDHIANLRTLSERCCGWICFDDLREETWVPFEEWQRLHAALGEEPAE